MSDVARPGLQRFPVGTNVGAYPASAWGPGNSRTGAPPAGLSAVETQAVASDGTLTYSSLTAGTKYRLGASVSGTWQWLEFAAGRNVQVSSAIASVLDTDGTLAANSDSKIPSQKAVKTAIAAEATARQAAMASGTLASRPSAATFGVGFYYATDDNGGTLYYSNATTWSALGRNGVLLDGKSITSPVSSTTTSTYEDATGLSVTVTTAGRPVYVVGYIGQASHSAAGGVTIGQIVEDGTTVRQISSVVSPSANVAGALHLVTDTLTPSAGSHTWKIQYRSNTAGTHTLSASATQPAFIKVFEC